VGARLSALVIATFVTTSATSATRDGALSVRDGVEITRYANGRIESIRHYTRGREEGFHLGWWPDGTRHFVYRFAHGVLEGEAREWFPNGTPFRVFHYAAGHEEGAQVMWYENGSLRANYVVRDGRRYGLPGSKGCTGTSNADVNP
jgi:antitoxin component YwqK of YwqJK toxin-antitoxin module